MAYLKGGTVVDGNLYVEGTLKVKNTTDNTGNSYAIIPNDEFEKDRIIKFGSTSNQVIRTQIVETVETENNETLTFKTTSGTTIPTLKLTGMTSVYINASVDEITVNNKDLTAKDTEDWGSGTKRTKSWKYTE